MPEHSFVHHPWCHITALEMLGEQSQGCVGQAKEKVVEREGKGRLGCGRAGSGGPSAWEKVISEQQCGFTSSKYPQ